MGGGGGGGGGVTCTGGGGGREGWILNTSGSIHLKNNAHMLLLYHHRMHSNSTHCLPVHARGASIPCLMSDGSMMSRPEC